MTAGFQLTLPGFDGPVDELPAVVSARQLALEEIPLASIPSQFLAITTDGVDLEIAGEVLAATARLMLMKSVQILAQPPDAEDDMRVAAREDPDPGLLAPVLVLAERQGFTAYPSVGRADGVPRISEARPVHTLAEAWQSVQAREADGRIRAHVPAFVRLEAAISRIISRLSRGAGLSFRSMLGHASRQDVVMHFLATLELLRRGEAAVEQDQVFGDIRIGRASVGRERADRAG